MKGGQLLAVIAIVGGGLLLLARRAQAASIPMVLDATTGAYVPLGGPGLRPPTNPFGNILSSIGTILGRPATTRPGNTAMIPGNPAGVPSYMATGLPSALAAENLYGPIPPTPVAAEAASVAVSGTGAAVVGKTGFLGLGGWAWAGIGAGAAALTWAIWKKGLFRGGEEALVVNPARDQYLAYFGPPGTGEHTGFHNLAATLVNLGDVNQELFQQLNRADTKQKFITATNNIDQFLASAAVNGSLATAQVS